MYFTVVLNNNAYLSLYGDLCFAWVYKVYVYIFNSYVKLTWTRFFSRIVHPCHIVPI